MVLTLPESKEWDDVVSDDTETNWILLKPSTEERDTVVVAGSGSGGRAELVENLDPSSVMFGGFRAVGVDDRKSCTSRRLKLVFLVWIGPDVPVMKRARAGTYKAAVSDWFVGTHADFDVSEADDISEEAVSSVLMASGGAHKPSHYEM
eukprot:PLAT6501.3.p2 GENE.PLAT6501.3~~PLAT6501.3.p2  ORF type:complete len:149 (+),score=63.38 PLAT6501.3:78-524(+)